MKRETARRTGRSRRPDQVTSLIRSTPIAVHPTRSFNTCGVRQT
ncbi:hypothetical protein RRSWK_06747 [Rhodopirellula sp. SWK7]|nr:hypothetical protein RRSWK_06747 [Rhodopirellula sp. SWK7]